MTFGNRLSPFYSCDSEELKCINATDRYFLNTDDNLSSKGTIDACKVSNFLTDISREVNLSNFSDCVYYTTEEFQEANLSSNFNVFHTNINGLASKVDQLQDFLSSSTTTLDIICITETSIQVNDNKWVLNTDIEGYTQFSTPSTSMKGGTSIYVKKQYDVIERSDLKVLNDHYESTWIELKNKTGKNLLCGSIYRHPHNQVSNQSDFNVYVEIYYITALKNIKTL